MEGKTVVAIAHRLSTIAAMDRLIVLDRGRIVEQGDASPLAQGGLYARLWAHQSGGFWRKAEASRRAGRPSKTATEIVAVLMGGKHQASLPGFGSGGITTSL